MTLPVIPNPTDAEIGGWIACCIVCDGWTAKAGALTAALEQIGETGVRKMLAKMKKENSVDLVKWLAGK